VESNKVLEVLLMADGIDKIRRIDYGSENLRINEQANLQRKPPKKPQKEKKKFMDVLHEKEHEVEENLMEKKKKLIPHAKYKNGRRII